MCDKSQSPNDWSVGWPGFDSTSHILRGAELAMGRGPTDGRPKTEYDPISGPKWEGDFNTMCACICSTTTPCRCAILDQYFIHSPHNV